MGLFTMPSLGADMESGRIVEWLVQPGDVVHRGDVVAVVDTTKAAIEVEVFENGTVGELLVQPGAQVDVGTPLALIVTETHLDAEAVEVGQATETPESDAGVDAGSTSAPTEDQSFGRVPQAEQAEKSRQSDQSEATDQAEQGEWTAPIVPMENAQCRRISLMVMPPVRHLALRLGVDLDSLAGTGPHGKITREDVESAATAGPDTSSGTKHPLAPSPEPNRAESGASGRVVGSGTGSGRDPASEQGREDTPTPKATSSPGRVRATPRARRLAAREGMELTSIVGTGAKGAVTVPDVKKAVARSSSKQSDVQVAKRTADESVGRSAKATPEVAPAKIAAGAERRAMRRSATAALMARSAREIPHYYVSQTVELTDALEWLHTHNADLPVRDRVLPAALFLRATVQAAQEVEEVNGHWVNDTFQPGAGVQLGVAVAMRDGGLLTPVIIDAHRLSLDELMASLTDLVRRARSGRLRSREIEPGSITVSSLADGGPDALFGVIYPPQVALVGIGGVAERPWAVDGALAARPTVTLTVAADHRATDGRVGAKFLAALSRALTHPEDM